MELPEPTGDLNDVGPALGPDALRALLDHTSDLITVVDASGRCTYASPAVFRMSGFGPEEVIGSDAAESMHPDDHDRTIALAMDQLAGHSPVEPIVFRQVAKDGSFRHVEALVSRLPEDHPLGLAVITTRDITERVETERVRQNNARIVGMVAEGCPLADVLAAIAQHVESQVAGAKVAMQRVADDGMTLRLACAPGLSAPFAAALDGIEADLDSPVGASLLAGHPVTVGDFGSEEMWPRVRDAAISDGYRSCWIAPVVSASKGTLIGTFALYWCQPHRPPPPEQRVMDEAMSLATVAFERYRIEEELAFRATHDSLTCLPNRTLLYDRINQALARRRRGELGSINVLFCDLDRFKEVNDRFGHPFGDLLLAEVASRFQATVREVDTVARFGGDEFVVVGVAEDPETLARRINQAAADPFIIKGQSVRVSCSIGISTASADAGDPESLIREADMALYEAKRRGRNCFAHFEGVPEQRSVPEARR